MINVKRILEVRALENEKELVEKRDALIVEAEGILAKAKEEKRAFEDAESKRYEEIKAEMRNIDLTLEAEEECRAAAGTQTTKRTGEEEKRALDEENFLKFVRGEQRALSVSDNGGIIPVSIANRIITKVKELSPIYSLATIYNVSGDLVFPVEDTTTDVKAVYVDDLQELTEATSKFTTIKLTNFIVGCLAKVSKSLINRTDFDLVGYLINKIAKAIAEFLEKELIVGTDGKMQGLHSTTNLVTSEVDAEVSLDDLIDVQMTVPEVYQSGARWIMHKNTLKALRKLKNADGEYILNKDATTAFGWNLLGKPVHITESCDQIATGKKAVFYGDMSGLYVKLTNNVQIQMLLEKFATQYAVGAVGHIEVDSKIVETQKIAGLVVK